MPSVCVNHRDFQAIDQANGIHPDFAVVETIIDLFNRWPLENAYRILEGNVVPPKIVPVLFIYPSVARDVYLHNVNMTGKEKHAGRHDQRH